MTDHLERIERDGYTIVENVFSSDEADALLAELAALERKLGIEFSAHRFEGHRTRRVYNLLVHGKRFEAIPVHPRVLPIVEGVLDDGCLVSSLSSIAIHPGEIAQPILHRGERRHAHHPRLAQGRPQPRVRGFAPRLRELAGFGVYRGLIGHIDKHSPVELLGVETKQRAFAF